MLLFWSLSPLFKVPFELLFSEEFVVNYTLGLLPEHLQSGGNAMGCVGTTDEPCVHEITTATFEEAVLNSNKVLNESVMWGWAFERDA